MHFFIIAYLHSDTLVARLICLPSMFWLSRLTSLTHLHSSVPCHSLINSCRLSRCCVFFLHIYLIVVNIGPTRHGLALYIPFKFLMYFQHSQFYLSLLLKSNICFFPNLNYLFLLFIINCFLFLLLFHFTQYI